MMRRILLLLMSCAPAAAAAQEPAASAWFATPFTGYPDVLALSWSIPVGSVAVEPGVSLFVPGASLRVGYSVDVFSNRVRRVELGAWLGGRSALGIASWSTGPTAEIGVRSWPRPGTSEPVFSLTVGGWWRHTWTSGDGPDGFIDRHHSTDVGPIVRLGFGKAFRLCNPSGTECKPEATSCVD